MNVSCTTQRRSWADVARAMAADHGDAVEVQAPAFNENDSDGEAEPHPEPLDEPETECENDEIYVPGRKGERYCFCAGEILVVLGHYGWLSSQCVIDHPDVDRNGGRIYFSMADASANTCLAKGDTVTFFLYADDQGLGAEDVQLDRRAAPVGTLSPTAAEFTPLVQSSTSVEMSVEAIPFVPKPMNAAVAEFIPAQTPIHLMGGSGHNMAFVPIGSLAAFEQPKKTYVQNTGLLNSAYFDDSDEEDSTTDGGEDDYIAEFTKETGSSSDSDQDCMRIDPFSVPAPPPGLESVKDLKKRPQMPNELPPPPPPGLAPIHLDLPPGLFPIARHSYPPLCPPGLP